MQFPDDWDQRARGSAPSATLAHPAAAGKGAVFGEKDLALARADLSTFAANATERNLSIRNSVLHAITSDANTIADKIEGLLPAKPHSQHDGTPRKEKRARSEPAASAPPACPDRSDMSLELDTLLSRLPYKELMRELAPVSGDRPLPSVPIVSRGYEERFMREKIHADERECCMGDACECRHIDPQRPFTAVEFVLPDEPASESPQACVLCSRAATQQLFYDIVFDNASFNGLIQRYGNLYGIHNEYAKEAMLICPPNGPLHAMPHPIVSHQRNRYTVVRVGGIHSIRQHGVLFQ